MNILCALPDSSDSVAWWRAMVPLNDIARRYGELDIEVVDFVRQRDVPWYALDRAAALMLSRPFLPDHDKLMHMADAMGKPVWVDYDDNYWEVPETNVAHSTFDSRAKEILSRSAREAAVITVSTETMRSAIVAHVNPDTEIAVVPNAFPDHYRWPAMLREKIVVYRGGWKSHSADLYSVADDLRAVMCDYRDWTFVFCGGHPIFIREPNMKWVPPLMVPHFHRWLRSCRASIMINPLEFTAFNACKSNIAWMEGSLAGAAVLAPDLPQYHEPGCTLYQHGGFEHELRAMLERQDRESLVSMSQKHIDENYRLSITNNLRRDVISALSKL